MKLTTKKQIGVEKPVEVSLVELKEGVRVCVSGKPTIELYNNGEIYVCLDAKHRGFNSLEYWIGNNREAVKL